MKRAILIAMVSVLFLLAGCFEKEPQTVSWYKEHAQERAVMLKKCQDNPGKYDNNPDCTNAEKAQYLSSLESKGTTDW